MPALQAQHTVQQMSTMQGDRSSHLLQRRHLAPEAQGNSGGVRSSEVGTAKARLSQREAHVHSDHSTQLTAAGAGQGQV